MVPPMGAAISSARIPLDFIDFLMWLGGISSSRSLLSSHAQSTQMASYGQQGNEKCGRQDESKPGTSNVDSNKGDHRLPGSSIMTSRASECF
jgi:hypothetical protein